MAFFFFSFFSGGGGGWGDGKPECSLVGGALVASRADGCEAAEGLCVCLCAFVLSFPNRIQRKGEIAFCSMRRIPQNSTVGIPQNSTNLKSCQDTEHASILWIRFVEKRQL